MNMSINNNNFAFRTPISLLNLLIEKDQSVINDLKTIFETLDNGDAMDIDGISDDEMRQILGVYIYLYTYICLNIFIDFFQKFAYRTCRNNL